jgi:hypothetical protein
VIRVPNSGRDKTLPPEENAEARLVMKLTSSRSSRWMSEECNHLYTIAAEQTPDQEITQPPTKGYRPARSLIPRPSPRDSYDISGPEEKWISDLLFSRGTDAISLVT